MDNNVSFDAMLQMAARESMYRQLNSFPSKRELEKMYTPSYIHENKMNRLIRKENRSDKFIAFHRQFSKVAVILLVAFTVTFTPLITAEAVRESIVQTVIEWKEEFASIFFKSERTPAVINEVKIGYMPEGFESEGNTIKEEYMYVDTYVFCDKHIVIGIYSKHSSSAANLDNENSDYYSISINDNEGILVYDEDFSTLIMYDNMFIYSIYGNTYINDLIDIYKKIEII